MVMIVVIHLPYFKSHRTRLPYLSNKASISLSRESKGSRPTKSWDRRDMIYFNIIILQNNKMAPQHKHNTLRANNKIALY